ISPADLEPDADLIGQGLDSIRMMSLSGRWRKLGYDVDFATLAANPTVRAWAALLTGSAAPAAPPTEIIDDSAQPVDQAFPLAPMQHAMWVGRNDNQDLGGVAGHLYVEFDGAGVAPVRLTAAAAALCARHPMLRVEFLPDGTQRIGDRDITVSIDDLRQLTTPAVVARLLSIRDVKSHQQLADGVLQLSVSL